MYEAAILLHTREHYLFQQPCLRCMAQKNAQHRNLTAGIEITASALSSLAARIFLLLCSFVRAGVAAKGRKTRTTAASDGGCAMEIGNWKLEIWAAPAAKALLGVSNIKDGGT